MLKWFLVAYVFTYDNGGLPAIGFSSEMDSLTQCQEQFDNYPIENFAAQWEFQEANGAVMKCVLASDHETAKAWVWNK